MISKFWFSNTIDVAGSSGNPITYIGDVTGEHTESSAVVDLILDDPVEGAYTLRQLLRLIASALFGKASGGGTATITFRDLGDSKDRITATVTSNGDRTVVVLDGS
jgi:hypothetical protein